VLIPRNCNCRLRASEAGLRSAQADAASASSQVSSAENNVNQQNRRFFSGTVGPGSYEADLINAEADYKRQTDMLEAQVGTRANYDAAKARVEGGRAIVEGGKAAHRTNRVHYSGCPGCGYQGEIELRICNAACKTV